ncbi:hypothetical protein R1sor_001865 [Riccia sorocarpa]|uniref:Uncharacterized protein n=1 Tax=Riccia sorocarpa TaxID=122646 RepID=A0ABD3GY09_9MARC
MEPYLEETVHYKGRFLVVAHSVAGVLEWSPCSENDSDNGIVPKMFRSYGVGRTYFLVLLALVQEVDSACTNHDGQRMCLYSQRRVATVQANSAMSKAQRRRAMGDCSENVQGAMARENRQGLPKPHTPPPTTLNPAGDYERPRDPGGEKSDEELEFEHEEELCGGWGNRDIDSEGTRSGSSHDEATSRSPNAVGAVCRNVQGVNARDRESHYPGREEQTISERLGSVLSLSEPREITWEGFLPSHRDDVDGAESHPSPVLPDHLYL